MKKSRVLAGILAALMLLAGCEQERSDTVDDTTENQETVVSEETDSTTTGGQVTSLLSDARGMEQRDDLSGNTGPAE